MTDTVIAACITVGGMVATAVTAAIVQIKITRLMIASEYRKIAAQITTETRNRRTEDRANRILNHVSELVGLIDPDINQEFDYSRIVVLILRIQLFLNRDHPLEKRLNGALNDVGDAVRGREMSIMLQMSNNVIESTQQLVNHYHQHE